MGAVIALHLCKNDPNRIGRVVLGGVGDKMLEGLIDTEGIARSLEATRIAKNVDKTARTIHSLAETTESNLEAVAACIRSTIIGKRDDELTGIQTPILLAIGTKDDIAGSVENLSKLLTNVEVFEIAECDHVTAVNNIVFKEAALKFLQQ